MNRYNLTSFLLAGLISVAGAERMPQPNREMQKVLDQLAELGPKPIETLTPEEARKQPSPADAVKALLTKEGKSTDPEPVGNVRDLTINGPGGAIPARVYTPNGTGPFPSVLYIHGGGWVIADLDTYDASPRALANAAKAVVLSTHYRQAPEHKFPASHQDVFAAYQWLLQNAAQIQGDPKRIAVVGESAGGNMAAGISLMARDQNLPLPVHQVLIYPVANSDFSTASYVENAASKPLNKPMMLWFAQQEFNSPADGENPLISLVDQASFYGLPATTVVTAEIDPLRSEGQRLVEKLRASGVLVRYKNYEGVTHEFFGMGSVLKEAKSAVAFAAEGLRKGFHQTSKTTAVGGAPANESNRKSRKNE